MGLLLVALSRILPIVVSMFARPLGRAAAGIGRDGSRSLSWR